MAKTINNVEFSSQPINRGMVYTHIPDKGTLLDSHTITGRTRWNKARTARRADVVIRVPIVVTSATKVERKIHHFALQYIAPQDTTKAEADAAFQAVKNYATSQELWDRLSKSNFDALTDN